MGALGGFSACQIAVPASEDSTGVDLLSTPVEFNSRVELGHLWRVERSKLGNFTNALGGSLMDVGPQRQRALSK